MLPALTRYNLCKLLEAEYTASNLTDEEFAETASKKLGFPGITRNHVAFSRTALKIEPNHHKGQAPATVLSRLDRIEAILRELGAKI